MKRSRLARRTRLVARTPLAPMSEKRRELLLASGKSVSSTFAPKRPEPTIPPARRLSLVERSKGWCEARLDGCDGRATDAAHRVTRQAGGRHGAAKERADQLSDLLHLCRSCHRWTHAYPQAANGLGLMLRQHQIPAQSFVVYRGEVMYLDDFGSVVSFEKAGT